MIILLLGGTAVKGPYIYLYISNAEAKPILLPGYRTQEGSKGCDTHGHSLLGALSTVTYLCFSRGAFLLLPVYFFRVGVGYLEEEEG